MSGPAPPPSGRRPDGDGYLGSRGSDDPPSSRRLPVKGRESLCTRLEGLMSRRLGHFLPSRSCALSTGRPGGAIQKGGGAGETCRCTTCRHRGQRSGLLAGSASMAQVRAVRADEEVTSLPESEALRGSALLARACLAPRPG